MADRGLLGPGNVPTILGSKTVRTETKGIGEQRGPILKIMKDESALKGRAGPIGSLKIIDDKWEHTGEKVSQVRLRSKVTASESLYYNLIVHIARSHPTGPY